jgi:hypothetical protein
MLVHIILHDDVSCYRPHCVCHLMGTTNKALKLLATVKQVALVAFVARMVHKTRTHLYTDEEASRLSQRQARVFRYVCIGCSERRLIVY